MSGSAPPSWAVLAFVAILLYVFVALAYRCAQRAGLLGAKTGGGVDCANCGGSGCGACGLGCRVCGSAGCEGCEGREGGVEGGGPFRIKVSDPEYTAMLEGKKTVEPRLNRLPYTNLKAGDAITVVRARPKEDVSEYPGGRYKYNTTIARVEAYPSLDELLKKETLAKVYPGKTAAEARAVFEKFLREGESAASPVLAFELGAPGAAGPHTPRPAPARPAKKALGASRSRAGGPKGRRGGDGRDDHDDHDEEGWDY